MENQLKATELRIGNYVYFKNTKDIGKVELIHNNHFDCRDEYGSFIPNGNYEPIQLTEDILVKLGFEKANTKVSGNKYFTNGRYSVMTKDGIFYFSLVELQSRYITTINFIHTLQNLFFSLTGEDLTFKK